MRNKSSIILLAIILLCVYFRWWFLPGIRAANDFPLVSDSFLKSTMNLPFVWSETGADGLGEYSTFFLWGWPLSVLNGIFANLGLSLSLLEKMFFLIPTLLFGSIGIWKLSKELNISPISRVTSAFFYLTNTYILLVIDGGQLAIALAYSWFPVAFLLFKRSITRGIQSRVLAGISAAVLGFFDFRFLYILGMLCLIFYFYQLVFIKKYEIKSFLKNGVISAFFLSLIILGLNAYWAYPLLKAPISNNSYQFFTQTSFVSFGNIGHSILSLAPNWFINVFGKVTPLRAEFIFIPFLVFLAPLLKIKSRYIGFWLIVAASSIFLSKGTSEPLSQIYIWLFKNVPGFSLFRDPTKFFFLVMLSYSILLGISLDEIRKKLANKRKLVVIFPLIIISYLAFLVRPVIFGNMTGTFSVLPLQKEYAGIENYLKKDNSYGRVFWIPSFPALGYADLKHPRIEAARAVQSRPFAIGTKGTYETFNFLREAPFMSEIFDVAGIGYIAYPYLDPKRDNMHPDNIKYYYTFLDQLSNRPWLSRVESSFIPLLKTKEHQDKFFITSNVWWVIGSDNIYNEATKSAKLRLSNNALIFAEERAGIGTGIDRLPEAKIVLNNKTILDLAASFINPTELIFPSRKMNFDPDSSGWWKRDASDLIRWRSFLQSKYSIDNQDFDLGGGWAVGEKSSKFKVQSSKFREEQVLLARVMESSRFGDISFYQENNLIGKINTKAKDTNVRWFEVGKLRSDKELKLVSSGDINVINALAILDQDTWLAYKNKAGQMQDLGRIVDFDEKNVKDSKTTVTYQQINPTKYKVSISGLGKPAFLVFSENYDGLWRLQNQRPFPVYSLLNGFRVDRNGDYVVEFKAQKYVYPGLIISGLTVAILLLFFRRYN